MPGSPIARICFTRIIPAGFVLGASIEAFMYYTGFWGIAIRKAEERDAESRNALRFKTAAAATPPALRTN